MNQLPTIDTCAQDSKIIETNNYLQAKIDSLRLTIRCALLLTSAIISGCISSVRATKNHTTWETIGEEVRTLQMSPRTEMLVNAVDNGYLDIVVRRTCETRKVKRTVEQVLYHEEREAQDLGTEFLAAGTTLVIGSLLIAGGAHQSNKADAMPENTEEEKKAKKEQSSKAGGTLLAGGIFTIICPIMAGHGIYTSFQAIDTEEYKDETRQTNEVLSSANTDCTTNLHLVLRTSKGIFHLGVTDTKGHLRVKLEDVIPTDILMSIIDESTSVEIGKF